MKARNFNSLMPYYHHKWCAEILGMNVNEDKGPDLIDEEKFIEIKFTLINPKKHKKIKRSNYPVAWTVLEHQMEYNNNGSKGYWGLGTYELDRPIKSIRSKYDLENFVLSRELYIVEFDWMKQFPEHHTYGKTEISEWDCYLRYPLFNKLPKVSKTYEVNGGKIHLTKGVHKNNFNLENIDMSKFIFCANSLL